MDFIYTPKGGFVVLYATMLTLMFGVPQLIIYFLKRRDAKKHL